MINVIRKEENGIDILQMKNDDLEVIVTNYGCTIMKLFCKDNKGQFEDVVLGYETVEQYQTHDAYLGALVGRVANRIGKGQFTLNDEVYTLATNNGPNHLHGGIKGFSYQIFNYEIIDDMSIQFSYTSKDGEEGYPGNLDLQVVYRLDTNALVITYQAITDKDTIINLTNHSYFNLNGKKDSVYTHQLQVQADTFACIDEDGLPTGWIEEVTGTPFDFRKITSIKENIEKKHPQLTLGNGFDHPFIFTTTKDQVELVDTVSGRKLVVSTTLPGAQIYTANFLDGRLGKYGHNYYARDAICIETQHLPDEINIKEDSDTILRKGKRYEETTIYRFEVI